MDIDASIIFGNVKERSIKEIWNERNEKLVSKHMDHDFEHLPEICKNCTDWSIIGENRFDEDGNEINKNYEKEKEMF